MISRTVQKATISLNAASFNKGSREPDLSPTVVRRGAIHHQHEPLRLRLGLRHTKKDGWEASSVHLVPQTQNEI